MTPDEHAFMFDCEGESLVGILSGAGLPAGRGVLIVVGGPQYRAGSHRQFTLLARHLDRKSTRLNSSHANISYAVFCLKKKNTMEQMPMFPCTPSLSCRLCLSRRQSET